MKIGKDFSFEAAHRLRHHDGKCRNLHGHSYRVFVTIEGSYGDELTSFGTSEGMLFDFGVLSEWWKAVDAVFDHVTILEEGDPLINRLAECLCRMAIFPWPPTAEHLAIWLRDDLKAWLSNNLKEDFTVTVRVYETAKSWAEA